MEGSGGFRRVPGRVGVPHLTSHGNLPTPPVVDLQVFLQAKVWLIDGKALDPTHLCRPKPQIGSGGTVRKVPESSGVVCCLGSLTGAAM